MKVRKSKGCVYCGEINEITKDHVVPKCLFTKPYPSNLITVKACKKCNNAKSLNEDYLRDFLVADIAVSDKPIAQEIFQKMLSSQRKGSSVIARETVRKSSLQPFYTDAGIYLGTYHSTPIDTNRIESIFRMLVCGLFYNFRKTRVPDNYVFTLRRVNPWDFDMLRNIFSRNDTQVHSLGEVFSCALIHPPEDSLSSAWSLCFYERMVFFVSLINPTLVAKVKSD